MKRIAKHLPALGVILGLAIVAPQLSAQETQTRDSAALQDTSDMQNPPGYRGMERDTTDTLTGGAIDSTLTLPADTTADTGAYAPSRLDPTDTTDTSSAGDTGAAAGRTDSASVRPGSTDPVRTEEPADRLNPTDSAGTDPSGTSQNP